MVLVAQNVVVLVYYFLAYAGGLWGSHISVYHILDIDPFE